MTLLDKEFAKFVTRQGKPSASVSDFGPFDWDAFSVVMPAPEEEVWTYTLGGVTTAIITLTYSNAAKIELISGTRTLS